MRLHGITALCVAAVGLTGCVPYTVGTTAQPVPEGERAPAFIWYTIPNGIETLRDSASVAFTTFDLETRLGVSDRADVGLRAPGMSGLVVTYKHRLTPDAGPRAAALAIMGGGGFVNLGMHIYFEGTLLASGPQAVFTPYGGLRGSQVFPLSRGAVSDSPTAGGFAGVRVGKPELGVSAEVGVYYDKSALGVRSGNVIVVPALVLHGSELVNMVLTVLGGGRTR